MTSQTQPTEQKHRRIPGRHGPEPAVELTEPPERDGRALQRGVGDPSRARPGDILALQHAAGNRAVSRLIQTKLPVGAANDAYEQEADRVADQVLAMPARVAQPTHEGRVQRQVEEEEVQTKPLAAGVTHVVQRRAEEGFDAGPDIEGRLAASKGAGSPLPDHVRSYMEPRFGADFSAVRVHTGGGASDLNRSLSAQAFTHGQDIYLGSGKYDPGTTAGKQLLAHELTHVVQQTGGQPLSAPAARPVQISAKRTPGVQRKFDVIGFYQSIKGLGDDEKESAIQALLNKWKGRTTLKSTRIQNSAMLMKGAFDRGETDLLETIKELYATTFPKDLEPDWEDLPDTNPPLPEKVESGARIEQLEELSERLKTDKAALDARLKDKTYQDMVDFPFEGEAQRVGSEVGGIRESGVVSKQLGVNKAAEKTVKTMGGGASLTAATQGFVGLKGEARKGVEKGETDVSAAAEASFLLGAQQTGEVTLTLDNKYASAMAKAAEMVRLGTWGKTKAEVQAGLNKGIGFDAAAYMALGGEIKLEGKFDAKSKALGAGIILEGEGRAFAGAEAQAEAEFVADLVEGIKIGISAGAFAGVKAEAEGKCMFQLTGRPIIGLKASVGVSFGAGGEVEAKVHFPTYGDSEIGFKTSAALGLGFDSGFALQFNLGNALLAAKEIWTKLGDLPSTMKGYQPTLSMTDQEIVQKLEKLIGVYEAAIKQTDDEIRTYEKTPEIKRGLLH